MKIDLPSIYFTICGKKAGDKKPPATFMGWEAGG